MITTGKANKEIDDVAALLVAHGYDQSKVQQFFAPLARGVDVYLYCIDEAVHGLGDARLGKLKADGLKLFACAYGAQRRGVPMEEQTTFSGLSLLSDLIASTDRFVSFN